MSKTNLQINERVQLIPFKHKGKQGVIKYIGEIEGKNQGNWIGIELDEPKGDCDGDCNGDKIFECKPGHGLFLRPTQAKSLDNPDVSMISKIDESLISGVENINQFIGSTIDQELNQIDKNFNLDAPNEEKKAADDVAGSQPQTATPAQKPPVEAAQAAGGGRVMNWKDRLAKLRVQKEQQKAKEDEPSDTKSISNSQSKDESLAEVKDIFAPAKGLQRDKDGKFSVDKEQVEEKKEIVFEKKEENLVQEELKKQSGKTGGVPSASAAARQVPKLTDLGTDDKKLISPTKTTRAVPDKLKPPTKQPDSAGAPKRDESKGPGGLRAPSRLQKPTTSSGLNATEQRKQRVLEKQKAVNAKLEEKAKQTSTAGVRPATSRASAVKESGAATSRFSAAAKSKVVGAVKAGEETKTIGGRRSSLGGAGAVTSRVGASGRTSARPGAKDGAEGSPKRTAAGQAEGSATTRVRGTSANKDKDLQFGRGRNTSASRDKDVVGLNRTRGTSSGKDKDIQFGKSRGSSKDRLGLGFGKSSTASTSSSDMVKIDPSMQLVKKKEFEELKADLESKKEEIYNVNLKMKKIESQSEVLKRDHKDELDRVTNELNEQHRKVHEELVLKHNDERNGLIQESNKSNDSKFNELKEEFDKLKKEKEELDEKLKQTVEDMTLSGTNELEQQQAENDKKYEEMKNEMDKKIEELTKDVENSNEKAVKLIEKISNNKIKIDELQETLQANKIDLEANQLELDLLKEEKDELLAEMTENNKLAEDDILNSLSSDELKQQNRKLRQAVTSLNKNFEAERSRLMVQVEDDEGKKKIIANYEKKLQDMDVLLEELDRKEEELAEVKMENEACLEYETMVEEMAQEILKKEDECDELEKKVKSLEEILGIQEGYSENLEQYNQELTEELAEKEAEVQGIEQQKVEDEELMLDLEDQNQQYREKLQQQTKTIKEFTGQIEELSDNSTEKNKMSTLLEKQSALVRQLRENEIREIDHQLNKIDYHWSNLLKSKVVEGLIPARLNEKVHFDSLEKLNILNQSMHRAMLMIRYICEKQMPNVDTMYGEDDESEFERKIQFVRMMIMLSEQAVMFVNIAQRIILCLNNMSVEQYIKATTTLMAWKKLEAVGEEMGHIIDKLKDENISLKFDTSVLEGHIKQVSELHFKIEKMFIEKTPEELAQEKGGEKDDDKSKYQMTPAQLERQKLVQNCFKLDVRHQAMRMCVAIVALKVLIGQIIGGGGAKNQNFIKKATLIYGRLIDIVFKLDHIDAEDIGKEYLNMQELVIDKRFNEKYEVIKIIWQDVSDPEQIQSKDWNSVLDAVQRDITQLLNDYKFKRLIKQIETLYQDKNKMNLADIDEIFFIDRFKNDQSPWMEISKAIKNDIQNFEALKDKIEQLNTKNREHTKVNMQQDRTINTLKVTNKSLESRLAQAQTKIEQLNQVKTENENLVKKQSLLEKKLEQSVKQIEDLSQIREDLQKKYVDLEEKAAQGALAIEQQQEASSHTSNVSLYRKARGQNQPSRQSRTSAFFQDLAKTSWLGGRQADSSKTPLNMSASRGGGMANLNSAEVQKHIYQVEENYLDIISQLQHDRMKLRGQKVTEKLNKLKRSDGALNEFIKNQKQKKDINLKLTREDQNQLEKAIENVDNLRTKVKLQMAGVKVVDLKKKREDLARAQQEEKLVQSSAFMRNKKLSQKQGGANSGNDKPDCVRTNMNINYMIIQAREQVNEAIQKLMTKDSKLSHLHIDKLSKHIEQENYAAQKANASTDDDSFSDDDSTDPKDQEELDEKKRRKEENKVKPFINSVEIGQIQLTSTKANNDAQQQSSDPVMKKNVVFKVKSLRALQNNIGVFSV